MCHKLTADDWDLLTAYPRLIDFLLEVGSESQAPLIHYLNIAKLMSLTEGQMDVISKPQSNHFANDEVLLATDIATWIERTETRLGGRIMALNMGGWAENNKKRVCQAYARLVTGHQNDTSSDTVLRDLKHNIELRGVKTTVGIKVQGTRP
jgi:hypothetical protein